MIDVPRLVIELAADVVRRRAGLIAENVLLRQQLIAAQRKIAGSNIAGVWVGNPLNDFRNAKSELPEAAGMDRLVAWIAMVFGSRPRPA